jgi:O-methyltransferase involved in polyketide biosynthesis
LSKEFLWRADNNGWDLATSAGATATMVTGYRAAATKRRSTVDRRSIRRSVGPRGCDDFFTRLAGGELDAVLHHMTDVRLAQRVFRRLLRRRRARWYLP